MRKSFLYVLLGITFFSGVVLALPANEVTTTYYSNAARTEIVGEKTLLCQGGISKWGNVTQWYERSSISCNPRN
jgi:hypothetical protein